MNYLNSNKNESKINSDIYPVEPKLPKIPIEDMKENNKTKNLILVIVAGIILFTLLG